MDHVKILKRAWNIVKNYRALWILGLILALTIGGSSSGGTGASSSGSQLTPVPDREGWNLQLDDADQEDINRFVEWIVGEFEDGRFPAWAITTIVVVVMVSIAISIVLTILRYRAQTSQFKMVDTYEQDGTQLSFKQGWRLGKSRAAWRMFLLDLGVGFASVVVVLLLLGIVALPNLTWLSNNEGIGVLGSIVSVMLFALFAIAAIVGGIIIGVMMRIARRFVVLDDQHPIPAIKESVKLIRTHWKSVGLMWLIMAGLGIAWIVVVSIATFIVVILSLLIGGLLGLLTFVLSNLFFVTTTAGIIGGVLGLVLFLVVVTPPMLFVNGMWLNYQFTVWTLTYRELTAAAVLEFEGSERPVAQDFVENNGPLE